MKCLILVLISAAAFAASAQARLGWTLDQCIQQYGPLVSEDHPTDVLAGKIQLDEFATDYVFSAGGFKITVNLFNGKVFGIRYTKGTFGEFTEAELKALFEKNAMGSVWHDPSTSGGKVSENRISQSFKRGEKLKLNDDVWVWEHTVVGAAQTSSSEIYFYDNVASGQYLDAHKQYEKSVEDKQNADKASNMDKL